jgi:hypothetical protein
MDEKIKMSWAKALHPQTLKSNIINASLFITAFEMLKDSIVEKIRGFYVTGYEDGEFIISDAYQQKVMSLHKSKLYASLKWLQDSFVIDDNDIAIFEEIKRCRNALTHEMLKFASTGIEFDVPELFSKMTELLRKIEIWWFENLEMAIDPDAYPEGLDLNEVVPGPIWTLQMLLDIALGPDEEARKYYDHFVANADKN